MSSRSAFPATMSGEATIQPTRATAVRNQAQFDRPDRAGEDMVCEDAQPAPQRHLPASIIIWIWS